RRPVVDAPSRAPARAPAGDGTGRLAAGLPGRRRRLRLPGRVLQPDSGPRLPGHAGRGHGVARGHAAWWSIAAGPWSSLGRAERARGAGHCRHHPDQPHMAPGLRGAVMMARENNAAPSPVLELRDVRKAFGDTEIIRGADLTLLEGERHALIGPNGAGKSTVF